LAFDELGASPSRQNVQDYAVSATGVVSRTFSVWGRQLVQYIIIFGITGAAALTVSFLVLFYAFGVNMVVGTNPISYLFTPYFVSSPSPTIVEVSLLLSTALFVFFAIIGGASIKYALDDYSSRRGDIGVSFSQASKRVLTFMAVQLVTLFLTLVPIYPGYIYLINGVSSIDISDPLNPIIPAGAMEMMMVGFVLLLVGAPIIIYFSARFAPAPAIVIDTDLSTIESLKKSWEITSGNVLHVIGAWILLGFAIGVLTGLMSSIAYYLEPYGAIIENIVLTLLFSVLSYIFPVILYRDLSSRMKESSLDSLML
jgi:membrane-anchored glycerophosphoryl diester phosphodiesterase (GDPDase)